MNKNLILIQIPAFLEAGILLVYPSATIEKPTLVEFVDRMMSLRSDDVIIVGDVLYASAIALLDEQGTPDNSLGDGTVICLLDTAYAPIQRIASQRFGTPLILSDHFYPELLAPYVEESAWTIADKQRLWTNEVDILCRLFHIESTYEAYPIWKEILLRSEQEFSPSQSVYDDMLKHIVLHHGSSISKAERSLRHMISLIWRHPMTKEWLEMVDFNLLLSHRRPSITTFYKACFYYLRRRMEQISVK